MSEPNAHVEGTEPAVPPEMPGNAAGIVVVVGVALSGVLLLVASLLRA